jgi:hypothetical protein
MPGMALVLIWGTMIAGSHQTAGNAESAAIDLPPTLTHAAYVPLVLLAYSPCTMPPRLIAPAHASRLTTLIPGFVWDAGSGSDSLSTALAVSTDPQVPYYYHGSYVCTRMGQGEQECRPFGNLAPDTTYYWRVNLSWDSCGVSSEIRSFSTGSGGTFLPAPAIIAPPNGITMTGSTTIVTLKWTPVDGAVGYVPCMNGPGPATTCQWTEDTQVDWNISDLAFPYYEWWVSAANDYALGAKSYGSFSVIDGVVAVPDREGHTPPADQWLQDPSAISLYRIP